MSRPHSLTGGNIFTSLIGLALSVLAALFLQTTCRTADMMIVGQFGCAAEVSAVSTGSWTIQTITTAVVGPVMRATVLLGRKIEEGQPGEAGQIMGANIWIFAVIGLAVTAVMQLLVVPCTAWVRVPEEAFNNTAMYMKICSADSLFIVAYSLLGSIFRGLGDFRLPLISVSIARLVNIAGDLLLVGVFHMALAGAAIATVFAQAVSVVLSVLTIEKQGLPFAFRREDVRYDRQLVGRVVKLGFPIAFQNVLASISFLVISAVVDTLGVIPSAGVGATERLCGFVLLVSSVYGQAMSVFVTQNIGARRPGRAKRTLAHGIPTSPGVGVFLVYFSFFHGDLLVGVFSRDQEVVLAAADYLRAYTIDCLLVSFVFCMTGFFDGCGKTALIMFQGIAEVFGVRIPVSYLMSRLVPVSLLKVGLAAPTPTSLRVLLCGIYLKVLNRDPLLRRARELTNHPHQTI